MWPLAVRMSELNPMWYLTSPEESFSSRLPSNSSKRSAGFLPRMLTSTLSRPRWAMPRTMSRTPAAPARRTSSLIMTIRLSPPSSEKRFWPT